jgi:hypothetical protein
MSRKSLPNIKNRKYSNYSFDWARGKVTIRAMIDEYPLGNIVTYTLSVRKGGELIERNTYAFSEGKNMLARVDEWRAIPKDVAKE